MFFLFFFFLYFPWLRRGLIRVHQPADGEWDPEGQPGPAGQWEGQPDWPAERGTRSGRHSGPGGEPGSRQLPGQFIWVEWKDDQLTNEKASSPMWRLRLIQLANEKTSLDELVNEKARSVLADQWECQVCVSWPMIRLGLFQLSNEKDSSVSADQWEVCVHAQVG